MRARGRMAPWWPHVRARVAWRVALAVQGWCGDPHGLTEIIRYANYMIGREGQPRPDWVEKLLHVFWLILMGFLLNMLGMLTRG